MSCRPTSQKRAAEIIMLMGNGKLPPFRSPRNRRRRQFDSLGLTHYGCLCCPPMGPRVSAGPG